MLAGILAGVLAFSGLGVLVGPPAAADTVDNGYTHTFLVNDARDVADAAPGDGECATRFTVDTPAVPSCTLYAAIQEANALPADASVLIAVAPSIRSVDGTYASSALIQLNWNTTNNPVPQVPNMSTNMVADAGIAGTIDADVASRYWVKHDDVTIDMQGRLGWTLSADAGPNVLLFTGEDQTLRNFTTLTSAEGGIYVGATAQNFSLTNGRVSNPASFPAAPSDYAIERGVVIVEGAKNTTITNVQFQRMYTDAVLLAPASNSSAVIDGLTIDQSSWAQPVNGGGYDPAYNFFVRNYSSAVSGRNIAITNNTVTGWGADGGSTNVIYFLGGTWTGVAIRGNTFTSTTTQAVNPIAFTNIGATDAVVRDNDFIQASGTRGSATSSSWVLSSGSTNGVSVSDNRISGGNNQVQFANVANAPSTSVLPIYRNTMTGVTSTTTAANENTIGVPNNIYNSANGPIRTAFATSATTPPLACTIEVVIAPPSTTGGVAIPTDPVYADIYLGRTTASGGDGAGLEQYLGRLVTTQSALPATFDLPYTGAGDGRIVRVQTTEIATGKTSQYSRAFAATGADTCAPQSWIKQGGWFSENGAISATQEDPTSFRNVHFQIRTSEPLGAALTAADIAFSGTAPGQQVVSLTQLSDTTWDLIAKANGTGTIVPSIPQGAITDLSGLVSAAPSNATPAPVDFAGYTDADQSIGISGADIDNSVLYTSPLAITAPDPLDLTVAEPGTDTADITISNTQLDADGRVTKAPSSPLTFTQQWSGLVPDPSLPDPSQSADGIAAALPTHTAIDATQPTMDTIDRSVTVPVQAIDNQVVDGARHVTLGFVVSSDDPEFDGLELPTTPVTVTDDDHPDATSSTLATTTNGAPANGAALNTVTATVQNAAGQPVSNAAVLFDVPAGTSWVGPDGTPRTADDIVGGPGITAQVLTDSAGEAALSLASALVGSYPVAALVNGTEQISASPQTVDFARVSIDPAAPGTAYTVSTGGVIADGTATHTITVTLVDGTGSPATGWESAIGATAAPASGVMIGAFAPTATAGQYTATLTSTTTGAKTIAVSVDDGTTAHPLALAGGGNADAVFVAGPPSVGAGLSSVSIDDSSDRAADGSAFHTVAAVLTDALGNPVTGAAARLSSTVAGNASGAVTVTAFSESATPGTYEALVRSTVAGAQQVTVTFDAAPVIGTVAANFAAGGVDLGSAASAFTVSTGDEVVGSGHHTVTVTLADSNGNPVSNQAAALTATADSSLGSGTITGFAETATPGTYAATVTSTQAGVKTLDVRLSGDAVTAAGNDAASFVSGSVDLADANSRFSVSDGGVSVGTGSHGVTVLLSDQYGNPVSGQAASLTATTTDDLGGGAVTAFAETMTPGSYLATITSTVSGGKTIAVAFSGNPVTLDGNDVATFIAGGVDTNNVGTSYIVTTGDQTVGTGSHTVTVTLADDSGNPVSGQAAGIGASTADDLGTGTITGFTESATPGTYTATITSTVSGAKTVTAVFGADSLRVVAAGNDVATFVAAGADLGSGASGYSVSAGSRPVGTGEHTVTATLVDALGNPVTGQAGALSASTADDLGAGAISAFSEVAPGSYEATATSTIAGAKDITVALGGATVPLDGNGTAQFAAGGVDIAAGGTGFSVSTGDVSVAGGSHSVTVTLTDVFGNPVGAAAPRLAAATADQLGTGAIGPFVETATGTYVATITSSVAGGKAIATSIDGAALTLAGNGNDVASFVSGGVDTGNAGTSYSVSTGDQTVGTGAHTVTAVLVDADGNPVSGEAAGLTATATGIGAGAVSAFTETATPGTYTATVSSTVAGAAPVTVSFGGSALRASGNLQAVFVAGAVDPTAAGSGYTVSGGEVSIEGGAHSVTITLTDAFGNPVSGAAAPLAADTTASLGTGTITGFTETSPPGEYTATVTSSVAGGKPVTAEYAGTPLALTGNGTAVFIAGGADTGNAGTAFSVSTGDQPVGSGAHTVTVTLADSAGNPVSGQAAALSAASTQSLGGGSVSAFTELATPGTYTASVSSTLAGDRTIGVDFGGSAITANGNTIATFVAGGFDLTAESTGYVVSSGVVSVDGGSQQVLAYLTDSFGNPVSGYAAQLAAGTADDLGSGTITGFVETATPGEYSATITSSVAGDKSVTVALGGSALQEVGNTIARFSAGETDLGAPGTQYSVSTGDQPVATGTHTITVTLTDAAGNPVPGQESSLTATTSADLGTGAISAFAESTPGTYAATITSTIAGVKPIAVGFDAGGSTGSVTLATGGNGSAVFIAAAPDLGNAESAFSVSTGDAVVVTGSHTVTVTVADQYGNPVSGQEAALAATTADDLGSGSVSVFTETTTAGTYTATVVSSIAGAKTIAVTLGGAQVTAGNNTIATFVAGNADTGNAGTAFAVSTGDQVVGTGSHTITVTLADTQGNPATGRAADLAAATADALGTGSISAFTETATPGTYTATVTSTSSGAKAITVSVGGAPVTAGGNAVASFAPAGVDLTDSSSAYSVSTGQQPVGTGVHAVTVTLADQYGNPVTGLAADLLATTTDPLGSGAIAAFAEAGTAGTYTATVTSSVAGDKTITVTLGGADVTLSGNGKAAFGTGGVDLGNAGSGFAVSTGQVSVDGGSHTVSVTLADSFGNPVSGEAASLAAATADDLGSGVISGFAETATPGTYTATITSTVSGMKPVTVTLAGNAVAATGNPDASFAASAVDLGDAGSTYTVSSGQVSVDGGSHAVTIRLADRFGNPVPAQAGQLLASTVDALGSGSITAVTETATPGTYSATIMSSIAGNKTVTVTLGGQAVTLDGNGTAAFVAGGVDPGSAGSGYAVSTGDQLVGTGQHTITVTLADADGNPAPGQAAGLSGATTDALGTGSISAFAETATAGTYTATITSSIAGAKTVTVAFGGSQLALSTTLGGNDAASFVSGAPDASAVGTTYTVSIGDQQVGTGAHTVTVTLADAFGNPVAGQAAALAASTGDPLGTGSVSAFAETATPGTYTATVTSTVAGDKAMAATVSGASVALNGNGTASFVAGTADTGVTGTGFSVSGGDVSVVTGTHLATITLADRFGNPVGGQAAALIASSADALGSGGISAVSETATAGTYTATIASSVAGHKTVAVTLDGTTVAADGNAVASFVAGGVDAGNAATTFSVSLGDQTVGAGTHTVTATLADASGNPVSGQAAGLAAATVDDLGTGAIGAFTETGAPGVYTATVASTVAGGKTITVTFGGSSLTLAGNGTATFVAGAVDPAGPGTTYTVTTGDQQVGTGAHTVTATLTDGYGNPVSAQAAALAAATTADLGSGVISGFAETSTPGTYTATMTSTVAGTKPVSVTLGGSAIVAAGNASASFSAGTVDLGDSGSVFSVSGGSVAVGAGSHTVTVRLADSHGNPVAGQAAALTAQTASDLGSGSISAFTETSTGVYESTITSTASGDKTVTVTFGGATVTLDGNDIATFVSGGVDVTYGGTAYSVSTGSVPVDGGTHTVTVTLTDASGNPVSGGASGLSASSALSLGSGTISAFTETATPGTYTATITSTVAGTATIAVRFGGDALQASGNTTAAFVAGGVELGSAATRYSVSTGSLPVGGPAHTVTVTLADSHGNPVSGAAAQLAATTAATLGAGGISAFTESTPGVYLAQVTSSSAGAKPIAVTYGGADVTLSGPGTATFVAGSADPSATTVTATSPVRADGKDASVVTVSLFDSYGNPVTAVVPVTIATTVGDVGPVTALGDGRYTASITSTVGGTASVSATVGGTPAGDTASVVFIDVSAPAAPVLDPSDGASVTGCAEPGSTVQVRDADGTVIGEAIAGPDCRFRIALQPPLAPGDRITVTATDPDGNVSPEATLRIGTISMELAFATREAGQQQRATGHGFQPGERVGGVMRSTLVDLGTQIADENGDVTFTFALPADIETGTHTVTLTGPFSGSVSETFTVTAPVVTIADTGSYVWTPALWLAVLALGGGILLLVIRRRGTPAHRKGER